MQSHGVPHHVHGVQRLLQISLTQSEIWTGMWPGLELALARTVFSQSTGGFGRGGVSAAMGKPAFLFVCAEKACRHLHICVLPVGSPFVCPTPSLSCFSLCKENNVSMQNILDINVSRASVYYLLVSVIIIRGQGMELMSHFTSD